ncbi:ABC transporter ATP-binding protein [Bordetella bronchialis]|uniref:ABC transporter ATP-binding protein n=1 Tax=Bordetella bronchialis TaxID=463025 RepID=UPI003CFEF8CE
MSSNVDLNSVALTVPHDLARPASERGDLAIRVSGLGKCFHIYDRPRDRLMQFVLPRLQSATGRPPRQYFKEFWALRDVSFEIKRGEAVGIIGRNGSGKSTILQIICGTLSPTTGSVETYGRIAALLELGSGFNPEFTGRENVYMNAAVLGLSRAEVDRRFDDILAFAEIGDFIDQPTKNYSSGMQLRLAFAVAINVDPEILVVDEALSVGDERFQRKCFSRIEEIRSKGATILFVSHSGSTVVELCDRAILLDSGDCLTIGEPKTVVGRYQRLLYASADQRARIRAEIADPDADAGTDPELDAEFQPTGRDGATGTGSKGKPVGGEGRPEQDDGPEESYDPALLPSSTIEYEVNGATIENPMVLTPDGRQVNNLRRGRSYQYVYTVRFQRGAGSVAFGMLIKTINGLELGGAISAAQPSAGIEFVEAGSVIRVKFDFQCNLAPGVYFLNAGVQGDLDGMYTYMHRLLDVAMFRVLPERGLTMTGHVDFGCKPEFMRDINE